METELLRGWLDPRRISKHPRILIPLYFASNPIYCFIWNGFPSPFLSICPVAQATFLSIISLIISYIQFPGPSNSISISSWISFEKNSSYHSIVFSPFFSCYVFGRFYFKFIIWNFKLTKIFNWMKCIYIFHFEKYKFHNNISPILLKNKEKKSRIF